MNKKAPHSRYESGVREVYAFQPNVLLCQGGVPPAPLVFVGVVAKLF